MLGCDGGWHRRGHPRLPCPLARLSEAGLYSALQPLLLRQLRLNRGVLLLLGLPRAPFVIMRL